MKPIKIITYAAILGLLPIHTLISKPENYNRCNKEALEQITNKYQSHCTTKRSDPDCVALEKDIQDYLTNFANKNYSNCIRMHIKYSLKPLKTE